MNNDAVENSVWKEIALKINEELVKFRKHDIRCSHILVGRKEYEEIAKLGASGDEFTDNSWSVTLIKVDEDSYLAGACMFSEKEMVSKGEDDVNQETD